MRLSAQHPDDEYYPYAEPEERPQLLRTDSALFYRAVQTPDDLYGTLTRFDLPQVALKRRGQHFARERIVCEGIAIGYRHAAALLLAGAAERNLPGIGSDADAAGSAGGLRNLRFPQGEPLRPYRTSVRITDRNYNAGARFTAERMLTRGWKNRRRSGPAHGTRPTDRGRLHPCRDPRASDRTEPRRCKRTFADARRTPHDAGHPPLVDRGRPSP